MKLLLLFGLLVTYTAHAQLDTAVGGKVGFGSATNETLIYLKCVDSNWSTQMPAGSVCMNYIFMHHVGRGSVPISNASTDLKTSLPLKVLVEDLPRDLWSWIKPNNKSTKNLLTEVIKALHSNMPNHYFPIEDRPTYDALLVVIRHWIEFKMTGKYDINALKPTLTILGYKEPKVSFQEMLINADSADPRQQWIQVGVDGSAIKNARPYFDVNLRAFNSGDDRYVGNNWHGSVKLKTDFMRTTLDATSSWSESYREQTHKYPAGIIFRIDSGPFAKHMGLGFVIENDLNVSEKLLVRAYVLPLQWGSYTNSEKVITSISQNLLQGFTTEPEDLLIKNVYSPGIGIQTRLELLPQIEFTFDADVKSYLLEENGDPLSDYENELFVSEYRDSKSAIAAEYRTIRFKDKSRLKRTAFTTDASLLFNLKSGLGISVGAYSQMAEIKARLKGEISRTTPNMNNGPDYIDPFDYQASRFDSKIFGRITLLYKFK